VFKIPAAFDKCVKNGGKVRTIALSGGRYRHVCILKDKVSYGHIKTKKK